MIGSGFGGAVSAYRLAEGGLRVCVLERGSAHPPGSFARAPHRFARNFWDPSAGLYGIFNVWFFRRVGAMVASGLGGGSLVYGNVLLRKDERWFVREDLASGSYEHWPIGRADLEEHYAAVEKILVPQHYPSGAPYDANVKINAFRAAAQRVAARTPALSVQSLPLAIAYGNNPARPVPGESLHEDVPNRYGVARRSCNLCGECSLGCNVGAKQTLDLNFLTRAEKMSAEIRTSAEVRAFRPRRGGGYEVDYVVHDPTAREGRPFDTSALIPVTVTCDRLVLAAGSLGTTYLLLKNAGAFPALSREQLGTRFSGNGDLLSVALLATKRVDDRALPWAVESSVGPPITHALRHADALDTGDPRDGRGFYLEDSGIPTQVAWMLEGLNTPGWIARGWRLARRVMWKMLGRDLDTDLANELADFLGPMALGARTMPMLGMGRDTPDGRFTLDRDRLQLDWTKRRSAAYFDNLAGTARAVAEELGAKFVLDPMSNLFDRVVTVHPLGGAPMGRNRHEGVTDGYGRVFGHPGLAIVDGAVVPGPVGANPSLTIAAIADRASLALASWKPGATWPA
ncbi:MAG: GMC oxidoreductase [Kofleriaceae bacterium]